MRQGRLIATGAILVFCLFAMRQPLLLSLTDRLGLPSNTPSSGSCRRWSWSLRSS
jgi:hypothetical protein